MCWFIKRKLKKQLLLLKSLQQYRIHNQPTDLAIKQEIDLYKIMANQYIGLLGKKHWPFAREQALACYRAAASLNDAESQYLLGKAKLEEGVLKSSLQDTEVFASASNARETALAFEEAHAFLNAAVMQHHIQAQRQLGLAYINGYGLQIDKDKGFDLIINSIEEEGSWDRVQKVLGKLGVNNAKFLSDLFQHRTKNK